MSKDLAASCFSGCDLPSARLALRLTGIRTHNVLLLSCTVAGPGCVSTGGTLDDVIRNIREAIELHLEGMRAEGLPIPEPSRVEYIEVSA